MLFRIRKSMSDKDQGFTLIELLVVVIVIGILAAFAIPALLNQRKKAVDASLETDLKNTAIVVHHYLVDLPAEQGVYVGNFVDTLNVSPTLSVKLSPGNLSQCAPTPAAAVTASRLGTLAPRWPSQVLR